MAAPQVTITLGRSGQKVVKETTGFSDGSILSARVRLGSKRSLEESFGTGNDDSYCSNDERTRGDTSGGSDIYNINLDDTILDPKDLRLKLPCKRISRHIELEVEERKKAALHEKMVRAIWTLESPEVGLLTEIPSSGAAEPHKMDSIRSSYTSQATNGARPKSPERFAKHSSGFSIPRSAVDRRSYVSSISHMDASRISQFLISDPLEYSAEGSFLANIPLSSGAVEPPQMDPVSNYTSQATSGERPQSFDRVANYFNGFSTPRTVVDQLLHVPPIRPTVTSRTPQFLISDPLDSAEGSFLANIPLSKGAAEPPQMDPLSSYTSQATTGERPQSSERVARYFNGFSTPKTVVDQLPHLPSIRPTDTLRTAQFLISDPLELQKFPLPTMSMAYVDSSKLVRELHPVTGSMFETPFTDILPPTLSGLLHSLGLGKYAINFQAEEIDMVALKQMGELDLKELGIPMGPRKKILSALHSMRPRLHGGTHMELRRQSCKDLSRRYSVSLVVLLVVSAIGLYLNIFIPRKEIDWSKNA